MGGRGFRAMRVAVLDDVHDAYRGTPAIRRLRERAEVEIFTGPFADPSALRGFDAVRAYGDPEQSRRFLEETLAFEPRGDGSWEARGDSRGSFYAYDEPPAEPGNQGAGTVHHVAWASPHDEHAAWHERVSASGAHPTPIIDRFYFRSIYFREPSGVLFEIATIGPGFTVDEPLE